ncbi:DegT/DnrJ/EryC1/StrS family aminotransferase [Motiliproteus sp.]|uniref:DegT/DnrJ/EryC1/StrS family aminotransferase n=1 Tax=Motiliproteus sp. TaxID=1898955 RepID=UPI003BA92C9C
MFDQGLLRASKQPAHFSRFLDSDVLFLPSGRVALYYALQHLGVTRDTEVLIPAYHCGSMVEPVIYLGATPRFFPLTPSLEIEPEQLQSLIKPNTKALLLPHFFGFPQQLAPLKQFCHQHQIGLIEDCAHAFFQQAHSEGLGCLGDFSITSTVKFFPGVEGGVLACNNPDYDLKSVRRSAPSFSAQLKSLLHTLELAAGYRRLGALGRLLNRQGEHPQAEVPAGIATHTDSTRHLTQDSMQWFTPTQIGKDATACTRFLTRHSDMQSIVDQRRRNYQTYLDAFDGLAGVKPLHATLPDKVVPYIFPLLLDDPQQHFPALKMLGVPIWRWEELIDSECPISADYRLRLIQLPCHQSLTPEELDWIIQTVSRTVSP